jgi:hypothetical protein
VKKGRKEDEHIASFTLVSGKESESNQKKGVQSFI